MTILNDGRPVFVETEAERIGSGPWARWLATAVVPDESSPRAERGRVLARTGHVHSVSIERSEITARVIGSSGAEYAVGLAADPVAPRVWAAIVENCRQADGSVRIPDALLPYMRGHKVIPAP